MEIARASTLLSAESDCVEGEIGSLNLDIAVHIGAATGVPLDLGIASLGTECASTRRRSFTHSDSDGTRLAVAADVVGANLEHVSAAVRKVEQVESCGSAPANLGEFRAGSVALPHSVVIDCATFTSSPSE